MGSVGRVQPSRGRVGWGLAEADVGITEAAAQRDTLAKTVYARVFDQIVSVARPGRWAEIGGAWERRAASGAHAARGRDPCP